jgi:hypothetical protein
MVLDQPGNVGGFSANTFEAAAYKLDGSLLRTVPLTISDQYGIQVDTLHLG